VLAFAITTVPVNVGDAVAALVLAAVKAPLAYIAAEFAVALGVLAAVNAAVMLLFCVTSVKEAALAAVKAPLAYIAAELAT
jgi:hypothetical protein